MLLPLKPDVPLPFGITVAEEPQSAYDRKNSDQDLKEAQLAQLPMPKTEKSEESIAIEIDEETKKADKAIIDSFA